MYCTYYVELFEYKCKIYPLKFYCNLNKICRIYCCTYTKVFLDDKCINL